jgi:hypothetical protein
MAKKLPCLAAMCPIVLGLNLDNLFCLMGRIFGPQSPFLGTSNQSEISFSKKIVNIITYKQRSAVQCSAVQCSAVQCRPNLGSAVQCSAVQAEPGPEPRAKQLRRVVTMTRYFLQRKITDHPFFKTTPTNRLEISKSHCTLSYIKSELTASIDIVQYVKCAM